MQAGCRGRTALRGGLGRLDGGAVRLDTVVEWVRSFEHGEARRDVGLSYSVQNLVKMVGSMELLAVEGGKVGTPGE